MRVHGLLSLTLPADDPAAARQWWADTLQLPPGEDDATTLDLGEVALSFGPTAAVRLVGTELEGGPARLVDPAGTAVEVVPPDLERAHEAEQTLRDFQTEADALSGPPVAAVVAAVTAIVLEARARIAEQLRGVPHNKVLAIQFALSQRARELGQSEEQWPLHAASTLMSGFVISGA